MMFEIFYVIGVIAIISGSIISAFFAHRASRFLMWMVAYLVLIVGVIQCGLALNWHHLDIPSYDGMATVAFILYNLGNTAVIAGRAYKGRSPRSLALIQSGGAMLAVSMMLLIWGAMHARASWNLVVFIALIILILITMPIGMWLSTKRSR